MRTNKKLAPSLLFILSILSFNANAESIQSSSYIDSAKAKARSWLQKAIDESAVKDPKLATRFSHLLDSLNNGQVILTDQGSCKQQSEDKGVTGFVELDSRTGKDLDGTNIVYLCEQAKERSNQNTTEAAQTLIHELTHLNEGGDECNSTFMEIQVSTLAGRKPSLNGYFDSCLLTGFGKNNNQMQVKNELNATQEFLNNYDEKSISKQVTPKADSCGSHALNEGFKSISSADSAI